MHYSEERSEQPVTFFFTTYTRSGDMSLDSNVDTLALQKPVYCFSNKESIKCDLDTTYVSNILPTLLMILQNVKLRYQDWFKKSVFQCTFPETFF